VSLDQVKEEDVEARFTLTLPLDPNEWLASDDKMRLLRESLPKELAELIGAPGAAKRFRVVGVKAA